MFCTRSLAPALKRCCAASVTALAVIAMMSFLPAAAWAQGSFTPKGQLTLIHGLPGNELDNADLGLDFPNDLPVDILVGLTAPLNVYFSNVNFGTVSGPLSLAPGSYQVQFRAADTTTPGAGSLIASATIAIRSREDHSTILYETTTRTPIAKDYVNDGSVISLLGSRVTFRHNSEFGPVDMRLTSTLGQPGAAALSLHNGQQSGVFNVATGPYVLSGSPAGQASNLFTPVSEFLAPRNSYIYYLVGSADRGTLTVITQSFKPTILKP